MDLSKNEQKGYQNVTMVSQRAKGWYTYLYGVNNNAKWNPKRQKNGDLGLEKCKSREPSFFEWGGGGVLGEENLSFAPI